MCEKTYCQQRKKDVEFASEFCEQKVCKDSLPVTGCCEEYKCPYHSADAMFRSLTGAVSNSKANLSREKKPCDICYRRVSYEDSFLLHTKTVLASDKYIDYVIREWVRKGMLPEGSISLGITEKMRTATRRGLNIQAGGTPWVVCKSCIGMFKVCEEDKAKAGDSAKLFWEDKEVEGV